MLWPRSGCPSKARTGGGWILLLASMYVTELLTIAMSGNYCTQEAVVPAGGDQSLVPEVKGAKLKLISIQ